MKQCQEESLCCNILKCFHAKTYNVTTSLVQLTNYFELVLYCESKTYSAIWVIQILNK